MFSMNTASLPPRASPTEAAFDAAVVRGVALIGVLKGFTQRVFGLGRVMKQVLDRLDKQGVDTRSANSGFDMKSISNLLRRAMHLADALRARLRTPAVALALIRPRSAPRREPIERQAGAQGYDPADPLWRITYYRADEETRAEYRQAIAEMSDCEVIEQIYSDLLCASAMLGETEEAAGVAVLGHKAAGLLAQVNETAVPADVLADEVLPEEVVPECADHAMSDARSDTAHAPCVRPSPPAVGRGPP
jgi:hypothetical protein